jgi:hypothetical protein
MRLGLTGATRTTLAALATTAALVALATPPAIAGAAEASVPPPDSLSIEVVTANGSGCPNSDATVAVDPDNAGFTLRHDSFFAHNGLGAEPTDFRKNCLVNLLVNATPGFSYAISRAERGGFVHLPDGGTALSRTAYFFQGSPQTLAQEHPFAGPQNNFWRAVDEFGPEDLVFSPCAAQRLLNINTEVRARTPDPADTVAFMLLGRTRTAVSHYRLAWRLCG